MYSLIGHFHPVFVHLPIGILVLAGILQMAERRKPSPGLHQAITISLLIGMVSAIISCITGYFLSRSDDYDQQLVKQHQWMGIGVAVVTIVIYLLRSKDTAQRWQGPLMILLIVLVSITGHIGGSLTHGSGYLTRPFTELGGTNDTLQNIVITDVQEAAAYQDVIQPLLQSKCYSCHNKNKQKGGLRMDEHELLLKGGKNGAVLLPGKPGESEMLKRILLPREEENHMPPKEKPQLTESEIALVHWWIASGASFDKKVKELAQPAAVKPALLAFQKNAHASKPTPAAIPAGQVDKADEAALKKIREIGVVIMPVSQNSHYLSANFVTAAQATNKDLALLLPVKRQLVWLKLGLPAMNDSALSLIAQCSNLTRLQLDHASITDAGLAQLTTLKELQYLNLVGTKVSAEGLLQLKGLEKLQSMYCYQTAVSAADYAKLQQAFPRVMIDTGGYKVPLLETDTIEVRQMLNK